MATETKTLNALYAERNKRLAANALLAYIQVKGPFPADTEALVRDLCPSGPEAMSARHVQETWNTIHRAAGKLIGYLYVEAQVAPTLAARNAWLAGFSPRAEQVHDLRSYLSAIATMLWEHGLLIDDPNVATHRAKAGEFA